jgi:hypothetical protein
MFFIRYITTNYEGVISPFNYLLNVLVVWHVLQSAVVLGWSPGLPFAKFPLWQVAQPFTMPVWFI